MILLPQELPLGISYLFILLDGSSFNPFGPLQGHEMYDKGVTMVLGEVDVARVNPYQSD